MSSRQQAQVEVSAIGIDIGKTTFHLIGQNRRGKIMLRARVSRSQLIQRLANIPRGLRPHGHQLQLLRQPAFIYFSNRLSGPQGESPGRIMRGCGAEYLPHNLFRKEQRISAAGEKIIQ